MILLDASAALALLKGERGQDRVREAVLAGSAITTVNLAEVVGRYVMEGAPEGSIDRLRAQLPIRFITLDEEAAILAGRLGRDTRQFGLSLGDRCCLATAKLRGYPVLTADRIWQEVGPLIDVDVQLIR